MPAVFPGSVPSLTNPTASDNLDTTGVEHHSQHANANDEIEAIATKVGTGSSNQTPAANTVLRGTGAGATAYGKVASGDLDTNIAVPGDLSAGGHFTLTALAKRLKGLFSDGTASNRPLFQTSTTNGNTFVGAIPDGTGNQSATTLYGGSDPDNASWVRLVMDEAAALAKLLASKNGTGTARDLGIEVDSGKATYFAVAGGEKCRVDGDGLRLITTPDPPVHNGHATPGALAKGWAYWTISGGTPSLQKDYNVSGLADNGAGQFTVSWDRDFDSANYAVVVDHRNGATTTLYSQVDTQAAGTTKTYTVNGTDNFIDPLAVSVVAFGLLS